MKEVSKRDFQINFYAYTRGGEEIAVYGRGGVVVGVWRPASADAVQGEAEELEETEAVAVQVVENAVQKRDNAVPQCSAMGKEKLSKSKNNMEEFLKKVPKVEEVEEEEPEIDPEKKCANCGYPAEGKVGELTNESGWKEYLICGVCARKKKLVMQKI